MDIAALFSQATREAARFREGSTTRPHHPARMYADCVDAFSEPLPGAGTPGETVIRELVEKKINFSDLQVQVGDIDQVFRLMRGRA